MVFLKIAFANPFLFNWGKERLDKNDKRAVLRRKEAVWGTSCLQGRIAQGTALGPKIARHHL